MMSSSTRAHSPSQQICMLQRALVSFPQPPPHWQCSFCKAAICSGFAAFSVVRCPRRLAGSVTRLPRPGLQLQVTTPTQDGVLMDRGVGRTQPGPRNTFTSTSIPQYGHSFSGHSPTTRFVLRAHQEYALATDGGNIANVDVVRGQTNWGKDSYRIGANGRATNDGPEPRPACNVFASLQSKDRFATLGGCNNLQVGIVWCKTGTGTMASSVVNLTLMSPVSHESNCSPMSMMTVACWQNTDAQIVNPRIMRGIAGSGGTFRRIIKCGRNNWGVRDYRNLRCGMALCHSSGSRMKLPY